MNTQTQEALHKALKVLNCLNNDRVYETAWVKGAINACEEALAQPAQEPVAWTLWWEDTPDYFDNEYISLYKDELEVKEVIGTPKILPLYTHPATSWQGLSDDEIDDISICEQISPDRLWHIYVAIEQALKEKNHG